MATSSERSPPPFPDSEEQDVLDSEDVGAPDSDEDEEELFMSATTDPVREMDSMLSPASPPSDDSAKPPIDVITEPVSSHTESKPASEVASEPSDDFVDLTNNESDAPDEAVAAESATADATADATEIPLDEPFVEILGSETEAPQEEAVVEDVTVEAAAYGSKVTAAITDPPADDKAESDSEKEVEEVASAPLIDISSDSSATVTQDLPGSEKIIDPLVDLLSDAPPADPKIPSQPQIDLFEDEESDLFAESKQTKYAKQPQKNLFSEPDEDLFSEPLGATMKKTEKVSKEQKDETVTAKAGGEGSSVGGLLRDVMHGDPADIFTEEAVTTTPSVLNTSAVNAKPNGIHSEEEMDIFAEATVELSLDSPRNERKKNVTAKPSTSASSLSAAATLTKPQPAALEELEEEEEQEEEEEEKEQEEKLDIFVSVTNPEKIGDGMTAYMAYKVSTQTKLPMFRNKSFTVRRRFSDFLGLYEKLSEKHGPNGYIVPPPPEKSILGMTKVKVGKEDSSSADFVERRRGALERYLQRVVTHPSLLQDPDVREFLEREELPRAVSTQALSSAGFMKMITKATDAVNKMTIKMNESDVWFEEKLQEVESADQQFRKLHAQVESLVAHRKELSLNTASFAKSVAMLGSAEDNTALSRALSQLAEVEDKMEQLHQEQAASDTFCFAELVTDYIRLLGAVRGSFDQRMKAWQRWQDAQAILQKKREMEAKLLWANKPDKLQQAKDEITEWEARVTQYEKDFDRVSATVRKEVLRFEKEKTKNFKRQIIKYLESLLQSQQQLIKYWEAFLPEAKAIA